MINADVGTHRFSSALLKWHSTLPYLLRCFSFYTRFMLSSKVLKRILSKIEQDLN